ncbi:sigma 54-interacting transcriptional regulator [Lampropedia aestuarii]|uniref:sigma 54-interacting transcriptional regulator n=1 Tax=Lampropedia aestuarii TaxID=2562762 RepID=UPI00246847EC|nr:sigma 54-interacting transcriptional regulator [Lampropedia aestuarii]MDH5857491.1 sigma 54-interacting transcriptional regulator [Lampropedia aestuarii]
MSEKNASILVVDDEPDLRLLYELTLAREGYRIETAETVAQAMHKLQQRFDVVLTDMRLPDGLGMELLLALQAQGRPERCIVATAYGSAENAVEALRAGAFDYLSKPVELKQLRSVIASAIQDLPATAAVAPVAAAQHQPMPVNAEQDTAPLRKNALATPCAAGRDKGVKALNDLVGQSAVMQAVKERISKVARSMAPVHIHGESGTGKELVARALHANSQRADGPMVAVNCGAIPENLLEAEFFGAKKGAYTGASQDRQGFFQAAKGGTLFLDEIGDLPLAMQTKLLRAIQERSVRPLGATQEEVVDVRLVSATHRDLAAEVEQGRFRQDLYYRLNVIELRIPALRERREDLPALLQALLARLSKESGFEGLHIDPAFMYAMMQRNFPGNVRELENLLHRAVALSEDGVLRLDYIADCMDGPIDATATAPHQPALAATRPAPTAAPAPRPQHAGAPVFGLPGASSATAYPSRYTVAVPLPSATPAPLFASTGSERRTADGLDLRPASATAASDESRDLPQDLQAWLDEQERGVLIRALKAANYNRTAAAAMLGLNLRQIRYRIERLNIPTEPETR